MIVNNHPFSASVPAAPLPRIARHTLDLTIDDIKNLLPAPSGSKSSGNLFIDLIDSIRPWPGVNPAGKEFPLSRLLRQRYSFDIMLFKFNKNSGVDEDSGSGYQKYLQWPDRNLRNLAVSIVKSTDSDDVKMYKIEQWVIDNIEYVQDIKNYGLEEYWAYPTLTLLRKKGDCEDGAFLIHSLALHAGIPYDRLRTYGGFVREEEGSAILGGHGWTSYRRTSDNEWVEIDWCYYPADTPLAERLAMKDDAKYVDDFFYVDAMKTVDASLINRIRKPIGGGIIDIFA